tara:strand:+ start:40 stop:825 length:786 start_codon:yes stop_codon:yes gene_type:complete
MLEKSDVPMEEVGFVYFIGELILNRRGEIVPEYIKIGWTTKEPKKRLQALQTSNPRELFLLGAIETNKCAEQMIHNYFYNARVMGEWFEFEKIKHKLVMWVPILSHYNFDADCLDANRFSLKSRDNDDNKPNRKTLFELTEEDIGVFLSIPLFYDGYEGRKGVRTLLNHTVANKQHFDIVGNIINKGDVYYRIDDHEDYYWRTKISKSSLSIFKHFLETFGLYGFLKSISEERDKRWAKTQRDFLGKLEKNEYLSNDASLL